MTDIISNAIKTILGDRDINRAIVDYLQSATKALKPTKEEWREVYYRVFQEPRIWVIPEDVYTGLKNQHREVYLHLSVKVHDGEGVAKLSAFMYSKKRRGDFYYSDEFAFGAAPIAHQVVLLVHDYAEAIDSAFALWDGLVEKFYGLTEPVEQETFEDQAEIEGRGVAD